MAPRVLVLGASGLLGGHLVARLPASFHTLVSASRGGRVHAARVEHLPFSVDAGEPETVRAVLAAGRPDVIVNAIGANPAVDVATLARVNGQFPRELAAAAAASGARVVQISTDAAFSGRRGGYSELDPPDPVDAYGRSKVEGELGAPHLTLRTSFFGRTDRGEGLIEWLVAHRGPSVDGFVDYRFTGIAAALLADVIAAAIAAGLEGLYHVGGDPMSKFDLLTAAAVRLQLSVAVTPVARGAVDRTLDSANFFAALGRRRPTMAESIEALTPCGALSRS